MPDLSDDPGDLVLGAGAGIDVGASELGRQQVPAAEDVQRQIAVALVIAMEEPAFLMAVHQIVGGIQVEHDLPRRPGVRLDEQIHQQPLDGRRIMADLVVAGRFRPAQFQPVQRRLARHRRAVLPTRLELAGQHCHHRVMAQMVVVVQILVTQRDAEHALANKRPHTVFDQIPAPPIDEARRKPINQADRPIRCLQQHATGIRRDRPAIERSDDTTSSNACKVKLRCTTLCRHRGTP